MGWPWFPICLVKRNGLLQKGFFKKGGTNLLKTFLLKVQPLMKIQFDIYLLLYDDGKFNLLKRNLKIVCLSRAFSVFLFFAGQIFGNIIEQICMFKQIFGWHRCFSLIENYSSTYDSIGRCYGLPLPPQNSADWESPQQIAPTKVTVGNHDWSSMETNQK